MRLQTQNSAITAELLFLGTNQNAGITSDFKMDIIKTEMRIQLLKHSSRITSANTSPHGDAE